VAAGPDGIADHRGIEAAAAGEGDAELRELGSAVARVAAQVAGGDAEAAVPFDKVGVSRRKV
jgi:hypothetical protein